MYSLKYDLIQPGEKTEQGRVRSGWLYQISFNSSIVCGHTGFCLNTHWQNTSTSIWLTKHLKIYILVQRSSNYCNLSSSDRGSSQIYAMFSKLQEGKLQLAELLFNMWHKDNRNTACVKYPQRVMLFIWSTHLEWRLLWVQVGNETHNKGCL